MNRIRHKLRHIWCRIVEMRNECFKNEKGAIWGMDYYYVKVKYLIPFWVREDKEEEYIEKYYDKFWLYEL